nr:cytochrome c oxidase subunit II [Sycophaga agraensis]
MSLWSQLNFQDSNSYIMESMLLFHDHAMVVISMITTMIFYMLIFMFNNKIYNNHILNHQMIEFMWTLFPIFFLIFLAIPSLKLLYLTDESSNPELTVKIIGHQWYWSYEYDDIYSLNFDSFMLNSIDYSNQFRLLDVDNRLILPNNIQIRMNISSFDVIHSFTVPSLGIKVDAVPGRINQINLMMMRTGLYFGQCSEICGVNHSFMPIVIESILPKLFINWIYN